MVMEQLLCARHGICCPVPGSTSEGDRQDALSHELALDRQSNQMVTNAREKNKVGRI